MVDHTAWSKINFFQSSFVSAPPSAACANSNLGIAGATGALADIAAAPETGGASLVALGVGWAALGDDCWRFQHCKCDTMLREKVGRQCWSALGRLLQCAAICLII